MAAEATGAGDIGNSVFAARKLRNGDELMTTNNTFKPKPGWMMTSIVLLLVVLGCARLSFAQRPAPKTFASPTEASNALFHAVQNDDEQVLQAVLGRGKEITSS